MSAFKSRRRRRRVKYNAVPSSQNNYFLVLLLSFIVLFETIILLFLVPKTPTAKVSPAGIVIKKEARVASEAIPKKAAEPKKIIPKKAPVTRKATPKKSKGKIAIVIDDWGYNTNNLDIVAEINMPLTLAILPFLNYSDEVAEFAHKHNYEAIIHMPMEPDDKTGIDLEPKTLMVDMNNETINKIMNDAFADIPYAKGVNNHMGSLATTDRGFILTVFRELKNRNLYFLDSFVVPDSVCRDVAKSVGIKFAKRSIFLDNQSSYAYIRGQIMELVKEVDKTGYAVGIGHDRESTLKVLREVMPQLAEEGYRFVFVSEIVK